ncbi:DNA directed RNA polymerase [Massariosphaeria phaeospora]|uniref:DNA directed RNA polymerase n=1 Tax=Massariosphaeria phaeospora TaxID=100035 RepID=A0A7C8IBI5_9PLEO|nr:DNA directed RNA polymerase [Massariosphaeria phaeospora]
MSGYQPTNGATGTGTTQAQPVVDERSRAVTYSCGDCDQEVQLKRGEPIRCRNCGHRVLYKQRTNRMVQFEAR